ncbi:MAG: hypothetical protein NWE83_11680 [Candidatus Bathyarchaeota archaeon]|nr:hypothetical protein [Candidatus Bathyarchaeota archaeon]
MSFQRKYIIRFGIGGILIVIGLILHWWSTQLLWILVYPPPFAKQLLEILPYVFWIIGVVLVIYNLRKVMMSKENPH